MSLCLENEEFFECLKSFQSALDNLLLHELLRNENSFAVIEYPLGYESCLPGILAFHWMELESFLFEKLLESLPAPMSSLLPNLQHLS